MNTRAPAVLLLFLLVAGGALFLLLRGGSRGEGTRVAPGRRVSPAPIESGESGAELARPSALAAPETAQTARVEGVPSETQPSAPAPWTVRVLRDGAPAADVEVAWASYDSLRGLPNDGKGASRDFVERVKLAGKHERTNAAGEFVVPALPQGSGIAAWDGALLAYRSVNGDETSPIVLELVLDRTLLVKVVDPLGAPRPSVQVLLDLMDGPVNLQWTEGTKGDGLATFRHVGAGRSLGEGAGGTVSIVGTFDRPIEAQFRVADWPETPLELVLPDHGSVLVEVVDETGKHVENLQHEVELKVEREQIAGAMLWNDRQRVRERVEGARARFGAVGLGLELRASVDPRPQAAPASVAFHGPLRPGEETVARLKVGAPQAVIRFRALDEAGEPLVRGRIEGSITRATDRGSVGGGGFSLETDGEGRVWMPLLETWHEGLTLTLALTHRSGSRGDLEAAADLSRDFPRGETDLGDVVFRAPEVLVAGRVVDAKGTPVPGAQARIEAHGGPVRGPILWDFTRADGSFSFPESATSSDLRLAVFSSEFIPPEPREFVRGARDVVVVLERGGAVEGSVVPPPGLSPTAFQVQAVRVERDGSFAVRGLAPGSVDFTLRLVPGNELLLEVPDVAVVDAETTRDPRLQKIALAGLVSTIHVRVRRPDGRPADGGWVRVLGNPVWEAAFLIEAGEALVLGRRRALDLEINVPGFRIERVFGVETDQDIVLQPAFRVRLELAREVELPEEGTQLQVRLSRVSQPGEVPPPQHLSLFRGGETTGWWNKYIGNESNTFGASREVFVTVQEPGTYTVAFFLMMGSPGGGMTSSTLAPSADTPALELDEEDADASFRVAPDPASYAGER